MPIGTKTLHVNPQSIRLDINVWVPVIVCNGDSFSLGAHSVNRRLLDRDLVISRNLIFPFGHDYYIYYNVYQYQTETLVFLLFGLYIERILNRKWNLKASGGDNRIRWTRNQFFSKKVGKISVNQEESVHFNDEVRTSSCWHDDTHGANCKFKFFLSISFFLNIFKCVTWTDISVMCWPSTELNDRLPTNVTYLLVCMQVLLYHHHTLPLRPDNQMVRWSNNEQTTHTHWKHQSNRIVSIESDCHSVC